MSPTDDPKRRAQDLIAELVEDAASVVAADIRGKLAYARGSTRVQSAWKALEIVLDRLPEQPTQRNAEVKPIRSVSELAQLSEQIRQLKQQERRQA